jgi:putative membrane protein
MSWIIGAILSILVTAVALYIVSKIPAIGVEIDGLDKAIFAAVVFGVLNGLTWILQAPLKVGQLEWVTFPILFLINVIVFGLTAKLVEGFRLRSLWSAVFGALALTAVNGILLKILPIV